MSYFLFFFLLSTRNGDFPARMPFESLRICSTVCDATTYPFAQLSNGLGVEALIFSQSVWPVSNFLFNNIAVYIVGARDPTPSVAFTDQSSKNTLIYPSITESSAFVVLGRFA